MGWASGSELADRVWNAVKDYIPEKAKEEVAREIVDAFESFDCDTMYECDALMLAAGLVDEDEGDGDDDE